MGRLPVRFPNVTLYRTKSGDRYRARIRIQGRDFVGPLRETAELAFGDVAGLRQKRDRPRRVQTLAHALEVVLSDAVRRGVAPQTIANEYAPAHRFLCGPDVWKEGKLVERIDVEEVCYLIRRMIDLGFAPDTIKKYLRQLGAAFRVVGVPDPIPDARAKMRTALKPRPRLKAWFRPEEVCALLRRLRTPDPKWDPRQRRNAPMIADLLEFIASSGIRAGEFGRMRIGDFDAGASTISIPEPKDRSNPRRLPLAAGAAACAARLVERARGRERTRAESKLREEERLVFPGGMTWLSTTMKRWQKPLNEKRLNGRVLRRTFGMGLAAVGATLTEIQGALGHRRATTTDFYLQGSTHGLRPRADALGAAFAAAPDRNEEARSEPPSRDGGSSSRSEQQPLGGPR